MKRYAIYIDDSFSSFEELPETPQIGAIVQVRTTRLYVDSIIYECGDTTICLYLKR